MMLLLHVRASATLVVTAAVTAALMLACSSGSSSPTPDAGHTEGDAALEPAALKALTVSSGVLRPAFDAKTTDYDVTSLNSLYPITVTATAAASSATVTIEGAPAKSGVASTLTLEPRQDITVTAGGAGLSPTTYTIRYVPSDLPAYTVTKAAGAGTEDILLTPGGEYALMIDRTGAPLYYRTFLPNDVENFQQVVVGGAKQYAVAVGITNPAGWTMGVDHVMDDHFADVVDYQLPAHAQHGVLPAEGHDLLLLGDQHYVAMAYVARTLDLSAVNPAWGTQAQVMCNLVQEVDHGNVLVEWDSANDTSLYTDSAYASMIGPEALTDYLHINSIDIDPADGNFIVSLRHTSSILKIDRHSAAVVWTLGGKEDQFGLTTDQQLGFQHHARVQSDGSLTVFDDGNDPSNVHPSRVVSFVLDEVNHKVTSFNVLGTKPASEPASTYMGSAVFLSGGRLLVGWGGWFTMDLAPDVAEIVGGAPVWSLSFTKPAVFSYRALPIAAP